MFLNILNKKEAEMFLELANLTIMVDGEKKEEEINMYNGFKMELMMGDYVLKNKSLEEICQFFAGSQKKVKRAVLIEILGIVLADHYVHETEDTMLMEICKTWNIREVELKKMARWVQDFNDLLVEGYEFINKK